MFEWYRDGNNWICVESGMPEDPISVGYGKTADEARDELQLTQFQTADGTTEALKSICVEWDINYRGLTEDEPDLPPRWELWVDGCLEDTVEAESAEDALDIAAYDYDRSAHDGAKKTVFVSLLARESAGPRTVGNRPVEEESRTLEIEPDEPDCPGGGGHDWQYPHSIVGGLKANPGVRGHGGGVVITGVCIHCGCARVTDTWAQNPENGEQGLSSVEYDPGRYEDEVERLRDEE